MNSTQSHSALDTPYMVKLDLFEGPFELLLFLVQKDEIDLTNIPIAHITQQYLDYLAVVRQLNLEVAGEFIVMAATLIRIKTQMLLPRPVEEGEVFDPRQELVQALLEYRRYKEGALILEKKEEQERQWYRHSDNGLLDLKPEIRLEITASLYDLVLAFQQVIQRLPEEGLLDIAYQRVTVQERMAYIEQVLASKDRVCFRDLVADEPVRLVVIVTFLALLELVRVRRLRIYQASHRADLYITRSPRNGGVALATDPSPQQVGVRTSVEIEETDA